MPILWRKNTVQAKITDNKNKGKMNYTAEIMIDDVNIYDILKPEMRSQNRTEEKITKEKNKTKITVTSTDSTALRASLNMITKLCTTYEKMKEI